MTMKAHNRIYFTVFVCLLELHEVTPDTKVMNEFNACSLAKTELEKCC